MTIFSKVVNACDAAAGSSNAWWLHATLISGGKLCSGAWKRGEDSQVMVFFLCVGAAPGGGGGGGGGGVLGPKITGGVPWATENWTQKDRGENGIFGPKRSNFVRICTQNIVFVLVDEKKNTPKRSSLKPRGSKKGGQNRGTYVSPIIYLHSERFDITYQWMSTGTLSVLFN